MYLAALNQNVIYIFNKNPFLILRPCYENFPLLGSFFFLLMTFPIFHYFLLTTASSEL